MSTSQEAPQLGKRMLIGLGGAGRRISARSNRGFVVVSILCVLAIVFFALGFAIQPAGSSPAEVPDPPTLTLSFQSGGPQQLFIYSLLQQATPAELVVEATGIFAPKQNSTRWTIDISGFTGYLCPKQMASLIQLPGSPPSYEINGDSSIPAVNGEPFLTVSLCWDKGAPLMVNGSYVSAALSPILAGPGQSGTVTRALVLSGTSISSYSLAGGIAPTEANAQSWSWTDDLSSNFASQARTEIPIIASSLPGIQHDNDHIFYSGIFFGIAGGAAVSAIPALLDASDRRRQDGKRRAAADHPHHGDQLRSEPVAQPGPSKEGS